ncbi:hypothetical protein JXB41_07130 [Candidatus Woesearchaeota archaeon]|nr:hypothetical protein [Candidatus Woesearchaeota archaeon]
MNNLPTIMFSNWYHWSDRTLINNCDSAGVYLLAKFQEKPSGKANMLDKNIIYIGETCNNDLKGRWRQFNRSAFQTKDGHSGVVL